MIRGEDGVIFGAGETMILPEQAAHGDRMISVGAEIRWGSHVTVRYRRGCVPMPRVEGSVVEAVFIEAGAWDRWGPLAPPGPSGWWLTGDLAETED